MIDNNLMLTVDLVIQLMNLHLMLFPPKHPLGRI